MTDIIHELRSLIERFIAAAQSIDEPAFSAKPLPGKWSKKEIVGHLVDSGHNNLRRFICAQYEAEPPHIVYNQDFWVAANSYQQMPKAEVLQLWQLINERICAVLQAMPQEYYSQSCNTGRDTPQLHTVEWLAADYVRHMKHHLNQVIPHFSTGDQTPE